MPPILRVLQNTTGPGQFLVNVELQGDDGLTERASAPVAFALTRQQEEDLRWYLEDYLQHPFDPAPTAAKRIEAWMDEVGAGLFQALFSSERLRVRLGELLSALHVEVVTDVKDAAAIPWELIRAPLSRAALPLQAQAFVRGQREPARPPHPPPQQESGPVRILLVICRPGGGADVPFRSVASRLLKGLDEEAHQHFQLDVLRPPTFEQLGKVLRAAKDRHEPYHVVHFDGHGAYIEAPEGIDEKSLAQRLADWLHGLMPMMLAGIREGTHGYLLFENAQIADNIELVDGTALGQLLTETDVPVLVLNACRSAHAEAPTEPKQTQPEDGEASAPPGDIHSQVRAFGSLAQEVMDQGVAGVVAMRYNVYVVTAAQFVFELYAALGRGHTLGEAVTLGRKSLAANPHRTIAYDPIPLRDWMVPIVYEALPITLFRREGGQQMHIALCVGDASLQRGDVDSALPSTPDLGFFGRDETLLALERAFYSQPVVLLHAYAGSGKTSTAAEFARWYALTGGLNGQVLFSTFERKRTLDNILIEDFGRVLGGWLEQAQGISWSAITDKNQRRDLVLQVLNAVPVLWVWDNVELIAGFPEGTESEWSADEQAELIAFLRAARETRAKFLLTSRREERRWLGDLPRRIAVPPMPMQERVQLTKALAERHGHRIGDMRGWRPLLRYSEGNPLTLTVLVGQALREGRASRAAIEAFVDALRAGEAEVEDDESQGRTRSLGASLSYGFRHAFDERERAQLALLHLFEGVVNLGALRLMGKPDEEWHVSTIRGLTEKAGMALLDRAAEIGLLSAAGQGYYHIQPALPWYFRALFQRHYPDPLPSMRAFVEAMGMIGEKYHDRFFQGDNDLIRTLHAEEFNLRRARHLARRYGWWQRVISTMQGLRALYSSTGQGAAWAVLAEEVVSDFVDVATDGPLPGRQEHWITVTQYRVLLAMEVGDWVKAERLQYRCIDHARRAAAHALLHPSRTLGEQGRKAVRLLAASLGTLGDIQRGQGKPECVSSYEESINLARRIQDKVVETTYSLNLGNAYIGDEVPDLRALDQAEDWYRHSLALRIESDSQGKAQCLAQIGRVARERFKDARMNAQPETVILAHLDDALRHYHQALDYAPAHDATNLAVIHYQLGTNYVDIGDLRFAQHHFRECIRYEETARNLWGAGMARAGMAAALANEGRFGDAFLYAQAALNNFQLFGDRATAEVQRAQRLIDQIQRDIQQGET